jgi:serine/threonine protein kinase
MSDFDLHRFLGAGGFGMVLLAQKLDTKRFYAIKVPTDTHTHTHTGALTLRVYLILTCRSSTSASSSRRTRHTRSSVRRR